VNEREERMQRYLAGEMPADERAAFEDEVLSSPELSDRLYSDISLQAAIETAARARSERAVETAPAEPWWQGRIVRWLAPAIAIAAVAVLMIARQPKAPFEPPVFRGSEGGLEAVEPRGDVSEVPSLFVWHPSDAASFYRFELFHASSSAPLFTIVTSDTSVSVDDPTVEVPARGYWVVTPLNDLRVDDGDEIITQYKTKN
jgi:hypothetical protein